MGVDSIRAACMFFDDSSGKECEAKIGTIGTQPKGGQQCFRAERPSEGFTHQWMRTF
jgi:hypothetical protein